MTWLNPWAWLGIATLALPILIHLLGLGRAKVIPFPSLRFLDASKLLPTRRTRIHDAALLLVRLAILLVAVAALARPVWLTANRKRTVANALARAIVVERGLTAPDSLASNATASILVSSNDPAREILGASEWLERQAGRRELVIVSHLRRGSLDSSDIARVPRSIGIRLLPIPIADSIRISAQIAGGVSTARGSEWTVVPSSAPEIATLYVAPEDRAAVEAAARAAIAIGVPLPLDASRPVGIAYPRGTPPANLAPIDSAWMVSAAARIRADSLLISGTSVIPNAAVIPSAARDLLSPDALVVAHDSARRPAVVARQSGNQLVLITAFEPSSLASAALLAAVARARSAAPSPRDLIATPIDAQTLASWQRAPATDDSARALGDASDGRWLWIVVLALLVAETLMRRARRTEPAVAEIRHDRAA